MSTPGVARAVNAAIDRLRSRGARVRDVVLPVTTALYDTMFAPIAVCEIRRTYASDWTLHPEAFSRDFATVFGGPGPSATEISGARQACEAFERTVATLFTDVDVLAMPAVPVEAPSIDGPIDGMRILRNTWPFNAARVPAISVPCGEGEAACPSGCSSWPHRSTRRRCSRAPPGSNVAEPWHTLRATGASRMRRRS